MRYLFMGLFTATLGMSNLLYAADAKQKDVVEGTGYGHSLETSTIAALCNVSHFVKSNVDKKVTPATTKDKVTIPRNRVIDQQSSLTLGKVQINCHVQDITYTLTGSDAEIRNLRYQNSIEFNTQECSLKFVASQGYVGIDDHMIMSPDAASFANVSPLGKPACPLVSLDEEIRAHGITSISRAIDVVDGDVEIVTKLVYRKK